MADKIVIITGANSGIGQKAALKFAENGYSVIMACRNLEKSIPIRDEIIKTTKNDNVILEILDISSFTSIKAFTERFKFRFPKLDILINNAAYFNHGEKYRLSDDDIEITFATNVAGPFLLTTLLSGHLTKSDDARVLNASSNIIKHYFSPNKTLNLTNLTGISDKYYKHSVYSRYCDSKMALLMVTFHMAELLRPSGIKMYSLQINGARMSADTLKKFSPGWRFLARIQNLFFPSSELMALNYFKICTEEQFKSFSGLYLNHRLEIMKPGTENPGLKHSFGTEYYPVYAENKTVQKKITELCNTFSKDYINK